MNCDSFTLITKKYRSTPLENQTVYYYLCNSWVGELECNEAEELFWISLDEINILDDEIEREAIEELHGFLGELGQPRPDA